MNTHISTILTAAVAPVAFSSPTWAEGGLKMHTTPIEVSGTVDIETGNLDRGIRHSKTALSFYTDNSRRTSLLTNLCVGYTMKGEFDTARAYCDDAVESGWYTAVTANNRGVLNYLTGQYAASIDDFNRSLEDRKRFAVARHNLGQANAQFAKVLEQEAPQQVVSKE